MQLLAAVEFQSPVLWGLVIGWIMTVVLHEFAHGVVAYWGGDRSIRERGGLTLNPLQYVDPVMSLVLPAVFMLMGGVPLPGGVTYVNRSLLRNKGWEAAVSLAGPMMNVVILLVICGLAHPRFGLFDLSKPVEGWTNAQVFAGALAFSQALAVVLNLMPIPPLDGFGVVSPFLPAEVVERVTRPPMNFVWLVVIFLVITRLPIVSEWTDQMLQRALTITGGRPETAYDFLDAFRVAVWGG